MKHETFFVQFDEFDSKQVNVSIGRKYKYWWIEPNNKPIKTMMNEVPKILENKKLE